MKKLLFSLFCLLPLSLAAGDKARITSERMRVDKDQGVMILEGKVRGLLRNKGTKLQAERMELRRPPEGGKVNWGRAEGNLWLSEENHLALADYAIFDDAIATTHLQGRVFVTTGELFLKGHKLDYQYEVDKGRLVGKKQPCEVIYHKKDPDSTGQRLPVEAWADEVLFNRELSKVVLQGRVKVIYQGDRSQMQANRVTLYFNEQEELERVLAEGHFRMTQPKRASRAARALFDYGPQTVKLMGKAFAQEVGEAAVRGEVIKMHMNEDLGIIESGRHQPVRIDVDIK